MKVSSEKQGGPLIGAAPELKSANRNRGCLKVLRRRTGLASRAAREVNTDDQYLDGHGPMVIAGLPFVKRWTG
jgi:hypothetical protein